jgi:UDP-N-acetylglucosamine--N-acetylmuramyl-(pentapeptide) pyrophosphoryl-undecaprenol N-acetylglucosamine transferase
MSAAPARARRWVVAGGGTGGHVTPALALAERIRARGDDVLVLGSQRGLETRIVPAAGFALEALPSRQLLGQSLAARLRTIATLPGVVLAARRALRRFGAEIVISVGGYAAAPAVGAAVLLGLPIALVNTDALPGQVNRLAARVARRIFVGFESAAPYFGARAAPRVRSLGIPLRSALVEAFAAASAPRRAPASPFHLLVFGGSQGARQLNETMMAAAPKLDPARVEIVHQSGEADRAGVAEAYAKAGLRAEVLAFEPEMVARYRWADVALCRAGALTVAELALAGLPALLVPYPWAAHDEQSANAGELVAAGAAIRLDPHALDPDEVARTLNALCAEPERLAAMGRAAARLARPDAAERIVEECANLLPPCDARGDASAA